MTSGKRITPAMATYILANRDRLFPAEIAHNLQALYGRPITKEGVRKWLQRNASPTPSFCPGAPLYK
ncbi:MAG: hypothetical protein WC277_11740 [Bacilli bacterium]